MAAIDPAVLNVKSNWETRRSRRAEKPNSERWRFASFIAITEASTEAWWLLMAAAAASRVERMACAWAGRSEAGGGKEVGVSWVVVQCLMGASPPFLILECPACFRLLVRSSMMTDC